MQILDKKYYDEIQKFVFLNFKNKEVIFLKNLNKENLDICIDMLCSIYLALIQRSWINNLGGNEK